MIAPSSRLVGVVCVVGVPAAALSTFSQEYGFVGAVACIALVAAALLDAVVSLGRLGEVEASLPVKLQLVHARWSPLTLSLKNPRSRGLSVALEATERLSAMPTVLAVTAAVGAFSAAEFRVKAEQRGFSRITSCRLETPSWLGFWHVRRECPVQCELSAYPDLHTEQRLIAGLFSAHSASGLHRFRQVGRGREFERVRDYVPGDPSEHIHWKASAKRGRPVTKLFQAERSQRIYVAIDASRTSLRSSARNNEVEESPLAPPGADATGQHEAVLEKLIRSALLLGKVTERMGDQFGLLTFSDRVEAFLQAKRGSTHFRACREALVTLRGAQVNADYSELFSFIGSRIQQRSLIIVLTNLEDPALSEEFAEAVRLVRQKHLVLVTSIVDPRLGPLFETGPVESLDQIYEKLSGHLVYARLLELKRELGSRQVELATVQSLGLTAQVVDAYIGVKRRQLL